MPDRNPEKVTLEDLLQLKRAERPAADFWPRFEQELRAKQLAAIVARRPWWQVLPRGLARFSLPVGAAAALALTFFLVQERNFAPATAGATTPARVTAPAVASNPVGKIESPALAMAVTTKTAVSAPLVAVTEPGPAAASQKGAAVVASPDASPSLSPWSPTASPEELSIANYFNATAVLEPGRFQPLTDGAVNAPANLNTSVPAGPVGAGALTPRDQRLARLLAVSHTDATAKAGAENVAQVHERISHRLSEDLLYASIHRFGLNGDSVTVKF